MALTIFLFSLALMALTMTLIMALTMSLMASTMTFMALMVIALIPLIYLMAFFTKTLRTLTISSMP